MAIVFLAMFSALAVFALREFLLGNAPLPGWLATEVYALTYLLASVCAGYIVGKYSKDRPFRAGVLALLLSFVVERVLHFALWDDISGLPLAFVALVVLSGGVVAMQVRRHNRKAS